ncbi:hypothetical protein [Pseudovibrio ascidiaceicola]|uniref:hypothetical protein n=1 Tax=Pseudovibrio ascidiaceicola TaxID=285279 RepID=UPI00135946B6|nr:hypothetical protein [Pseudovibrio ascidiaceicola]
MALSAEITNSPSNTAKPSPPFSTVSPQTLTVTGTYSKLNLHKANSLEEHPFRR